MDTKRDVELLFELGTLRHIQRVWVQFHSPEFANLAEHHMRVAWIALIIAKHENATNTDKILKMALVHDIPEGRTGDVHHISRQYTKRDEHAAIADMLKDTALEQEMKALWEEYEKHESQEAQIVKDADFLDVDLELQEQASKGNQLREVWSEQREKGMYPKLFTETARKLFTQIRQANVHDWQLNAPNRYNSGDWKPSANKS